MDAKSNKDIGWRYGRLENPRNRNNIVCAFCEKVTRGGIYRHKQHLAHVGHNVTKCPKVSDEVKELVRNYMQQKKSITSYRHSSSNELYLDDDDTMRDSDEFGAEISYGKSLSTHSSTNSNSAQSRKRGAIESFFRKEQAVSTQRKGKLKQTTIDDRVKKYKREETCQYIARWFYQAGIPFNTTRLPSFQKMIEEIGEFGKGMKGPSYHELRVPLLKKEIGYTENLLKSHKEKWVKSGCSIMSDGWTDRKDRTLINFLVNSPQGSVFMESIDASSYSKTGERLFELLDGFVEKVGEKNVVQVITDNASAYVLAGKMLEAKRPNLFWTPCAAHCIELMLEDIGMMPKMYKLIKRAVSLSGYIYNHSGVLNLMRQFTKQRELLRPAKTRFATSFLTLQSLYKHRQALRHMFNDEKWRSSKWVKEVNGKVAETTVLTPAFWNGITYALKITSPLVRVLRLVDGEKRPAMGYIYEAIDRAKEAIKASFNYNDDKYKEVLEIIDRRWNIQLNRPLYAAGYFLNPEYFYSDSSIQANANVMKGFYASIKRLVPNESDQDKICVELYNYKEAQGLFGDEMAIRQRKILSPVEWWHSWGQETPTLRQLAIRILSLTCSASGCERNWSIFEHIHSKKKNRLEQKRLNDLVFIKYNQKLKSRYAYRDTIDPISLSDIDDCNEWLVGKMQEEINAEDELVFPNDTLTWGQYAEAAGIGEGSSQSRRNSRSSTTPTTYSRRGFTSAPACTSASTPLRLLDLEEDMADFEDDENFEVDAEGIVENEDQELGIEEEEE